MGRSSSTLHSSCIHDSFTLGGRTTVLGMAVKPVSRNSFTSLANSVPAAAQSHPPRPAAIAGAPRTCGVYLLENVLCDVVYDKFARHLNVTQRILLGPISLPRQRESKGARIRRHGHEERQRGKIVVLGTILVASTNAMRANQADRPRHDCSTQQTVCIFAR